MYLLNDVIGVSSFPVEPKRVPACIDRELEPFAGSSAVFTPQERSLITNGVQKLLDRAIIHLSTSPQTAKCLSVFSGLDDILIAADS